MLSFSRQVIVQRALASANVIEAQKGCVLCGFLKVFTPFMFVVPGMAAAVLFPSEVAEDTNQAYPMLVTRCCCFV